MKLSIGFINDVHGYIEPHPELFYKDGKEVIQTAGGYSRISTIFKSIQAENKNALFFDGGDTFHGTLPLIESKGEAIIPILNALNFSGMVGHWDFGYGHEQLKKLATQLKYPVLGINVFNDDGSLFLPPYIIKNIDGLKIGIIGICSNIIDKTMPKKFSKGIKLTDGSEELPVYINKARSEGAEIIILLSHNGFPQDAAMLSKIKGIDICLSAHTHNRLYEVVEVNDTILIQCGCHGSFVGHLNLEIENSTIISHEYKLITNNDAIAEDHSIKEMVNEVMAPYQKLKLEVLGQTSHILHRYNTLESSLDDLLLAAVKWSTASDIAFSNGWRYGVPINIGNITKWDLYNIVPMNPYIATVEMTGGEIITMLEENLERTFSAEAMKQMGGYIKRVMGLNVKMRIENPKGHRIQEIYFGNGHLNNEKNYTVAFVTSQGVPEKFGRNRKDTDTKVIEGMCEYLKKNKPFTSNFSHSFSLV